MLSFIPSHVRYEPYPLIVLRPAMDQALYDELTRTFPTPDLFTVLPKYEYKLSLSEKFAAKNYHRFLAQNAAWNRFHSWIKSDDFVVQTAACLKVQHIDLELRPLFRFGRGSVRRRHKARSPARLVPAAAYPLRV